MTAKPTHTKTDLPPGLYADRSYLALVIRTGYKLAYYVTIDYPMRLHHLSIDSTQDVEIVSFHICIDRRA